jgi:hypothetical protein
MKFQPGSELRHGERQRHASTNAQLHLSSHVGCKGPEAVR